MVGEESGHKRMLKKILLDKKQGPSLQSCIMSSYTT
jgi:hypothetical protein